MNEPYILSAAELWEMIRQNNLDIEETKHVTESSKRGETYYSNDGHPGAEKSIDNRYAFFKEVLYRDRKTDGFIMQYPHGIVINQGAHNSYYRGENQVYACTQPSLYRALEELSADEKRLYCFVADMRVAEFRLFIDKLGIVQFWAQNYGSVLYEPIAQHYGLETEWLDITSDLNVALFFATCRYDKERKWWLPLTKADTEQNENTKYGVIFHIPGWQADSIRLDAVSAEEYVSNEILPIGYQPFMRCHSQHGYGICMREPFPLQDDIKFEELRFRHDEEFSKEIYEKLDCGRKIYPQEGLGQFSDIIDEIKTSTTFGRDAYSIALENNEGLSDAEVKVLIRECDCTKLFGAEIVITDEDPIKVSRQRIRACNRSYEGFSIEKNYGIKLFTRMVYVPGDSWRAD